MALLYAWPAPAARAQGAAYCNITSITTRRLANAVQITIQADGTMRVDWDFADFFDVNALQKGRWEEAGKPITILPFRVSNARSRVVPLTDVGVYPASHVEVSVLPDAPEGIGVNLKFVLFTPAIVTSVHIPYGPDIPADNVKIPTVSVQMTPDQTRLIVLIASDRRTPAPLELRRAPSGAPVELNVTVANDRVTVDALNAALPDVLREIGAKAGRRILLNGGLDHIVSLHLEDMPPEQAISSIAMAYSLAADTSGPAVRVAEASAASLPAYEQSDTVAIPCLNTTAVAARDSLPEFLLNYLRVDTTQNALTVTGPAYLTDKVRADVIALDQPVPVVEVEAQVVEFASSQELDALLDLGARKGESLLSVSGSNGDISFRSPGELPSAFTERLHAMLTAGKGRIVARPHATALLGQEARLFVGQSKYITILYFDMLLEQWMTEVLPVDVGSKVTVRPLMVGEAGITVELKPEVNSVADIEPRTGLPTINTRSASATMRVAEGDTVAVGGLAMEQRSRRVRKIPILSDIPLLGGLFRGRSRRTETSETAFFITARVVRSRAIAPAEPGQASIGASK